MDAKGLPKRRDDDGTSSSKEDEAIGWVPIPGRLHPTGLDEVEAMKYGLFPVRERKDLLDNDGKKSDLFFCDRAAYQIFNNAHLQGTELGAWVQNRLRLGVLFVSHNHDKVPGWKVITLFGRPKVTLQDRAKKVIVGEWLKLHGLQDDAECVESAKVYIEGASAFDEKSCSVRIVFVCGNTRFAELLRKEYTLLQPLLVQRLAVDKSRDVPPRMWHVTSQSSSQLEEECLDESQQKFSYQREGWAWLRGVGCSGATSLTRQGDSLSSP